MDLRAEALKLIKAKALREGPFKLASGATSNWYVDLSQVLLDGKHFDIWQLALKQFLRKHKIKFTAVGGLTMGADPLSLIMASATRSKSFSIRQAGKDHGADSGRIVGALNRNDTILIVDDVATTGNSLLESILLLLEEGMKMVGAMVLVDRSGGQAAAKLESVHIPFYAVFESREIRS